MPPTAQVMFAEVNADGSEALAFPKGTGYTSSTLETGEYEVDFNTRVLTTCAYVATVGPAASSGGGSASGYATVAPRSGNSHAVYVETFSTTGALANEPFHLVVTC